MGALQNRVVAVAILVVLVATYIAWPHPPLDWHGVVLPMARRYAGISNEHPLKGKVVVITGPTSGIGMALTTALTKLGASVIAVARSPTKLRQLQQQLPNRIIYPVVADMADLVAVSKAADQILESFDHIDILINNAGIVDSYKHSKASTEQGFDRTFAVNYLSHFLLTEKLMPLLVSKKLDSSDGKSSSSESKLYPTGTILQLSSSLHGLVDGTDLMPPHPIASQPGGNRQFPLLAMIRAYGNSKFAQILHARALQQKPELRSVRVISACPAWVVTNIARESFVGHALVQRIGYPVDGWGISSALYALFDVEGGQDKDFYINTIFSILISKVRQPNWASRIFLRDIMIYSMGAVMAILQKLFPYTRAAQSSSESYNSTLIQEFYDWSLNAVAIYK